MPKTERIAPADRGLTWGDIAIIVDRAKSFDRAVLAVKETAWIDHDDAKAWVRYVRDNEMTKR